MKQGKILSLLLALIFSVGILAACGPQEAVNTNSEATHQTTNSNTDTSPNASEDVLGSSETTPDITDSNTETSETDSNSETTSSEITANTLPKEYWAEEPGKKFGQDVVLVWMQPSEKTYWDYTAADFPEADVEAMSNEGGGETVCIALILKTPSKENVISTIRALEKRSDVYKATPEYDLESVPFEFKEDTRFSDDRVWANIQPSSRHHTYTVEDFPELECVSVRERRFGEIKDVCITLKYPSKENVIAAIKLLEKREDLYSVRPNQLVLGTDAAIDGAPDANPNDAEFVEGHQWGLTKIQAPFAWDIATGRDTITVGVIDSGIDATHPDLQGRINSSLSKCFVGTGNSALEDLHGHGTHVAGIIGAQGNNEDGVSGVCWNVSLVSLRISIENENGMPDNEPEAVKEAIKYATQQGIDIINISSGNYNYNFEWEEAIRDYPGLFVCSAGNDGTDLDGGYRYPGSYQFCQGISNIIVVGASTSNDERWIGTDKSSNHGTTHVDLFAPGASIYSCIPGGYCQPWSGTSMAAPHVAGVAALILSTNPNMSTQLLKAYILNNADVVSNLAGYCKQGTRLNAYRAVSAAHPEHDYTADYDYFSHTGYCQCGASQQDPHSYTYHDDAIHRSYCVCGVSIETHDYTTNYIPYNGAYHKAQCDCGVYILEIHDYIGIGDYQICTLCAHQVAIYSTEPEHEIE